MTVVESQLLLDAHINEHYTHMLRDIAPEAPQLLRPPGQSLIQLTFPQRASQNLRYLQPPLILKAKHRMPEKDRAVMDAIRKKGYAVEAPKTAKLAPLRMNSRTSISSRAQSALSMDSNFIASKILVRRSAGAERVYCNLM